MLDDAGTGIARLVHRREGDEQAMVAQLPVQGGILGDGRCHARPWYRRAPGPCRSCPPSQSPARGMREGIGRAARLIDDLAHALAHPRRMPRPRMASGAGVRMRRSCAAHLMHQARLTLHCREAMRAACSAQLQRRGGDIALADAGDERVALLPGDAGIVSSSSRALGIRPLFSPGNSMPVGAPRPSLSAASWILSMPSRRAVS